MTEISLESVTAKLDNLNKTLEGIISRQDAIIGLLQPKQRKSPAKVSLAPLNEQMLPFQASFPPREYERFLSYWTEEDAKGVERWRKQPTWNVKARMRRWMMNKEDKDYAYSQSRRTREDVGGQPVQRTQEGASHGFEKIFS